MFANDFESDDEDSTWLRMLGCLFRVDESARTRRLITLGVAIGILLVGAMAILRYLLRGVNAPARKHWTECI